MAEANCLVLCSRGCYGFRSWPFLAGLRVENGRMVKVEETDTVAKEGQVYPSISQNKVAQNHPTLGSHTL